jgi:hypothetical protein
MVVLSFAKSKVGLRPAGVSYRLGHSAFGHERTLKFSGEFQDREKFQLEQHARLAIGWLSVICKLRTENEESGGSENVA